MTWLSQNWLFIVTVWVITHTIAQTIHAKADPSTWYGKVAAVWSAINPLDVVKGLNALGAQFVPPMVVTALDQATAAAPPPVKS
jgi:hypothetical protein